MNIYTTYRTLVRLRKLIKPCIFLVLSGVLCYAGYRADIFLDKELGVAEELLFYDVGPRHDDDTLRVAVIGDSWAEYHMTLECDTIFCRFARRLTSQPVKCFSIGHSGKTTKEVYYEMFRDRTVEHSWDRDRCSQPLMEQHPDYCIIMAGINDMRLSKPKEYYVGNYRWIIDLLVYNNIRPVVMEMPGVDLKVFNESRKFYKRWMFDVLSWLTKIDYSSGQVYRDAMKQMLQETGLDQKVLFIPISAWNSGGVHANPELYLDDRLHLNMDGYHVLDSCMAVDIVKDYQNRINKK